MKRIAILLFLAVALILCACGVPEQVKTNLGVKRTVPLTRKSLEWAIILCHDKTKKTADAFAMIVPELLSRGYQLVTVSELLHFSEDGFHVGAIYASAN